MTTESEKIDDARSRAEARFKRMEQQKTDAEKVWVERDAKQTKQDETTTRLRALRLAKEEAERGAEKPVKPKRVVKKKAATASA